MQFVRIPPGTFMMGCSAGDSGCYPEEKPVHRVVITRAFEIGKYLVTQQEYSAIVGKTPSYFRGANLPVDSVSWEDARKFCEAFNDMQNDYRYRLPTEAEWEYAARGGNNSAQYGVLDEVAWSRTNSDGKTHPIGGKKPNGFGMYDTLGNLWEWVQDWYGLDYYHNSPEADPKGPESGEYRILRGGSWRGVARGPARVSSRYILRPGVRSNVLGFRCVREAVD
jgi:formylglycine-generating enzyme required for sulfatase activity